MYDKVSKLYKDFVEIYCHKYYGLPDDKRKKKTDSKYNTKDLFFDRCDYSLW